jgi:hypothetical protein
MPEHGPSIHVRESPQATLTDTSSAARLTRRIPYV